MNKYRVSYIATTSCADLILANSEEEAAEYVMNNYALGNQRMEFLEINNVSEENSVPDDQFLNYVEPA